MPLPSPAVPLPNDERADQPIFRWSLLVLLSGALLSALLAYHARDLALWLHGGMPRDGGGYLLFALVLAPLVGGMVVTEMLLVRWWREASAVSRALTDNPPVFSV
jgi:hypothetical protein